MAKYNSSVFGNISGEVLGVVASSNKGINFIKSKAKTADAKTQKQLERRAIYGKFCTLWEEKSIEYSGVKPEQMFIKKQYFKLGLRFCLKFSQSASLMSLTLCPDDGTMSAPVYIQTSATRRGDVGFSSYGVFLFPGYSDDSDFVLCSGYFGASFFQELKRKTRLEIYAIKAITDRQLSEGNRIPNNSYMASIGQKTYRSFWYINKKTGQTSKPLCLACDDLGNIETFYPFGK